VTRPDRATVLRLLAQDGQQVTHHQPVLVEDVDGIPAGVGTETTTASLYVTPELLGWTYAELGLDDPETDQ